MYANAREPSKPSSTSAAAVQYGETLGGGGGPCNIFLKTQSGFYEKKNKNIESLVTPEI